MTRFLVPFAFALAACGGSPVVDAGTDAATDLGTDARADLGPCGRSGGPCCFVPMVDECDVGFCSLSTDPPSCP